MGADEVRNLAAGDTLPEDVELVVRGVRAPRPRWARCCGRPPAAARSSRWATCPAPPSPAVLGDLVTREITWVGSYRFVEEISDALAAHARRPGRDAR